MLPCLVQADDDLLHELLEEERRIEQERLREAGHQYDDEYLYQQQQEMVYQEERRRQQAEAEEQRLLEQELERIRTQREAAFERELAKMNEEQQKEALKQKRRDARVVKRILRAARTGNYYRVLGLLNFESTLGPFSIFGYQLGPFTFFRIGPKDIKKAYRSRAMQTHPDKNRDGRAQEAFFAVEESASVLGDERLRVEYDFSLRYAWIQRRDRVVSIFMMLVNGVRQQISRAVWVFRNLLGPFATPMFIIGCLMI
jgi:hypothetical protein